jgi:hypothetical protein
MPEVLARFETTIVAGDTAYRAQACGAPMPDGIWEGWIEFIPVDGGTPVRSPRETTQPNRVDTAYWASGLTPTYLEGALDRALRRPFVKVAAAPAEPVFNSPAPEFLSVEVRARANPILDPFSVYERGDAALRQKLNALSEMHLVNIVVGYGLSHEPIALLSRRSHAALVEIIVAGVAARATSNERA